MTVPSSVARSQAVQRDVHEVMNTVLHDALRRDIRRIAETLRGPVSVERRLALVGYLRFMLDRLHHHHTAEDDVIWPRVIRRRPELTDLRNQMESEHGRLGWVVERLVAAANAWETDGASARKEAVRVAVIDLGTVLDPHLRHEEEEAMPVICQALTKRDWRRIDRRLHPLSLPSNMAENILWMLDDLDPQRTAAVQSLLPKWLWRLLRPRFEAGYRRRHSLLWG
jgi:hemerythrin-like domain-containing protein